MGTNSYESHRYLSDEEINIVLNEKKSLKKLFDQLKNADGLLSLDELKQLTMGLIDDFIIKKIIKTCGTKELGMTCQDFLYFYALLNTSSTKAKLNFILDFIFFEKSKIDKEEYILNINTYLYNSGILLKIFLNDEVIQKSIKDNGGKIKRDEVYKYIMEKYTEEMINYKLFKNKENYFQNNENITIKENNNINNNKEYLLDSTQQNIIINNNNKTSKLNENDDSYYFSENPNNDENNNDKNETLVINNTGNNNSFISKTNNDENKENTKGNNTIKETKHENTNSIAKNEENVNTISKNMIEKNKIYEKMKKSFQHILKEENGTFPISLFESMLKEINVLQSLIDIIGNFLRQKSQKTFINFYNFKEIINLIIIPDINFSLIDEKESNNNPEEKTKEEIINGLFTLFAFPNEYISKKNFFLFAKATKPQLSSNTIKEWFNEYKITSVINKKKFKEIIEFIYDELYESFEHIKYLPYIFFKVDIPDKKMEKKCIDVLLKNKSLEGYIQERLQIDDNFYIINKEFWDKWNLRMNRINGINNDMSNIPHLTHNLSVNIDKELKSNVTNNQNNINIDNINNNDNINEQNKLTSTSPLASANINNIKNINSNNNNEAEEQLKFNTEKIADKDGRLKEGLVYRKDFVVLSSRMYNLFYKWYGTRKDIEIKRTKIYLDEEINTISIDEEKNKSKKNINNNLSSNLFPGINNGNESNNNSSNKISLSKIHLNNISSNMSSIRRLTKNYSFLKGINKKTHQKFEIELYPVFLLFFNFTDMQKKDCNSLSDIVESIKENSSKDDLKYYPFSRKTKFSELLQTLQNSLRITLNKNNARLWLYYKNSFEICDLNDTLEKNGIVNSAVIILEINENSVWPSDKLNKQNMNKAKDKNFNFVGLNNIGNTCYMNSILQLFLNNPEIKKLFLDQGSQEEKFYEFIMNKSHNKNKGELITEFIDLLKEKFLKNKKTITPKKFKEICGKYNSTFKGYDQQDAHDFYTFLVNNLHEETNIKSYNGKKYDMKEESDTVDTTELELSNEYWANSIRENASYIYDLFFGQMKSKLTCNECNKIKLKYENFSAVELPILEGKKIILEIILFRLPCTLSPFYKTESYDTTKENKIITNIKAKNNNYNNFNTKKTTTASNNILNINSLNNENANNYDINMQETKGTKDSLRKKLKKLKLKNIGKYAENLYSSLYIEPEILNSASAEDNMKIMKNKINREINYVNKDKSKFNEESNLNTVLYEKYIKNDDESNLLEIIGKSKDKIKEINDKKNNKNDMISNPLNLNIPIRLKIEIERNKKNSEIIEILKKMDELKLEKNSEYTEFIIIGNNKYIKQDSLVDETFLNLEQIFIYELLNYEGIKKIFGYDDLTKKANDLSKQDVQSMLEVEDDKDINTNTNILNKNELMNMELNDALNELISNSDSESKDKDKDKNKDKEAKNNLNINNNINNTENEINEILLPIFHEYQGLNSEKVNDHFKLFNIRQYLGINNITDFIILTNKNAIKPVDLYEIIWEKYMYFLNSPTKYESILWWRPFSFSRFSSSKNLISPENPDKNNDLFNITSPDNQQFIPFLIKIVKKSTRACIFCPWFRLCQGCALNPGNQNYLSIPNDSQIIVEWKRDVVKKDMKEENLAYILNHSSVKQNFDISENEEDNKNIYDCLDLFTREETVKNIFCEKCNKKTNFKKRLEIDKFPKYLTLILKRFKYTKMFTTKIDNFIQFPIEDLDMTHYITPKEGKITYNLFGVVNHSGTLTGGHYHCDIKQENIWVKYDDSYTTEYNKKIVTENAYLLIYKLNETKNIYNEVTKQEFKLNLLGLMDTAYKIYLKEYNFKHFFNYVYENNNNDNDTLIEEYMDDCHYYYGEPITVNGKMGFLVNIYKNDESDKVFIKIKVKKGYYETNVTEKKIIKETVKITGDMANVDNDGKNNDNEQKTNVICGGCIII